MPDEIEIRQYGFLEAINALGRDLRICVAEYRNLTGQSAGGYSTATGALQVMRSALLRCSESVVRLLSGEEARADQPYRQPPSGLRLRRKQQGPPSPPSAATDRNVVDVAILDWLSKVQDAVGSANIKAALRRGGLLVGPSVLAYRLKGLARKGKIKAAPGRMWQLSG